MNQPFRSGTPLRAAAERSVKMAGGNKHASAFSLENEETAAFLKPRAAEPSSPLHAMRDALAQGKISPDIRPANLPSRRRAEQADAPSAGAEVEPPVERRPVSIVPQIADPRAGEGHPEAGFASGEPDVISDAASLQIAEKAAQVNKGGRPLQGKERKVERTVSMHKPLDKLLERLSNHEGIRLDRNVSTASVAVHLMMYALSHVKDNAVFPADDGKGLTIALDPQSKGLVAATLKELVELDEAEASK